MLIPVKDFKTYHPDIFRIGRIVVTNNFKDEDDFTQEEIHHFFKTDNNFKLFIKMIINLDNAEIRMEDYVRNDFLNDNHQEIRYLGYQFE